MVIMRVLILHWRYWGAHCCAIFLLPLVQKVGDTGTDMEEGYDRVCVSAVLRQGCRPSIVFHECHLKIHHRDVSKQRLNIKTYHHFVSVYLSLLKSFQ